MSYQRINEEADLNEEGNDEEANNNIFEEEEEDDDDDTEARNEIEGDRVQEEDEDDIEEANSNNNNNSKKKKGHSSSSSTYSPLQNQNTTSPDWTLRVLKEEQSKEVTLSPESTVNQLKTKIESAYGVPISHQRLVFKGKPLKPNEATLASFRVADGAAIHLFPVPPRNSAQNNSDANFSFTTNSTNHIPGIPPHLMRPLHFVPEVIQSIREVKMWCYILIITSTMDIFTNLSFLGSQGHPGRGLFDSIVNVIQTVFSFLGLYVGQLGLKCTTTTEEAAIKNYVHSLVVLAFMNICLKAAWLVDIILLAKKSLHDNDEEQDDPDEGGEDNADNNENDDQEQMSDTSFMIYFSIQAVIMAAIAISMWVACVNRARSFQRLVHTYEGIANRA